MLSAVRLNLPMRDPDTPRLVHSLAQSWPEPPWPAWLAAAVIQQALHDVRDSRLDVSARAGAHAFLRGSDAFRTWCHVAGLQPDQVQRLCRARARSSTTW